MGDKGGKVDEKTPWTVVCAIDFGTTYSGYSYSFKTDYDRNPLEVFQNPLWKNEGDGTLKTPTCILFDKNQQFDCFGYEAEQKYASLAESAQEERDGDSDDDSNDSEGDGTDEEGEESESTGHFGDWFFFRRFKMNLFKGEYKRSKKIMHMKLTAENGKRMEALVVFTEAIRYLKNHFQDFLETSTEVEDDDEENEHEEGEKEKLALKRKINKTDGNSWSKDVLWVITVPAIWSDEAKQFMRKAANNADIPDEQLVLALEPESAAIFCKHLSIKRDRNDSNVRVYQEGKQFMVVDCGGGTVDVTAYEVQPSMSLKELHCASGDAVGGTNVDRLFFQFLEKIFGETVLESFRKNYPSDWLELLRSFEAKKRGLAGGSKKKENNVTFSNCLGIFEEFETKNKQSAKSRLQEMDLKKKVSVFSKAKLRIDQDFLIETAFVKPIQEIIEHLQKLFEEDVLKNIQTILLVGGFSDCLLLQNEIRKHFVEMEVITPRDANIAIMKGAVIFGHSQEIIVRRTLIETGLVLQNQNAENIIRKSRKFYGIATNEPFVDGFHPPAHQHLVDGEYVCTDVFKCMVKKNEELHFGRTIIEQTFCPASLRSDHANIEIYAADTLVTYCNEDNCRKVGHLIAHFDEKVFWNDTLNREKRKFKVQMHFGFTEIIVTAIDLYTGDKTSAKVNFE